MSYLYLRHAPGLEHGGYDGGGQQISGIGACVVPASVSVRKLQCTDADLAAISAVAGKRVTAKEVRDAITRAVEQAVGILLRAAQPLTRPRPDSTSKPGDRLIRNFNEAFGVPPSYIPSWRPAGAQWDRGDVVQERLRCAARILSNGSIRYRCWGPRSCRDLESGDFRWRAETWAAVRPEELRICFGEAFWKSLDPSQTPEQAAERAIERASTVAHEALHIYFHTITHTRDRGPFGSAACYERFVLLMNKLRLSQYVEEMCRSGISRGDFPLPKPGGSRIA